MNEPFVRRTSAAVVLLACACVGNLGVRSLVTHAPAEIVRTIDVNTARAYELELLPNIGPALAQRIVDDRDANGSFLVIEDLDRVRGIGEKTLDGLRDHAAVN